MDTDPWNHDGELPRTGPQGSAVTLVDGADFCLSARNGDIRPRGPHGLFVLDTRFLCRLELLVDDRWLELLGVAVEQAHTATFFGRIDKDVVVLRRRTMRGGLIERITVRNHGGDPRDLTVEVAVDADFADLFEVKESRVERVGWYGQGVGPGTIQFARRLDDVERRVDVTFGEGAVVSGQRARWRVHLEPGEEWTAEIRAVPSVAGAAVTGERGPSLVTWRERAPRIDAEDVSLTAAVEQAIDDLGSLRIFDPEYPDLPVVAAGAPWFMSPFGRDALLTGWMALVVDPVLARGALETFARFQGRRVDPASEEEPGRILHEMRFSTASNASLGGGSVYYGSVDSTPLFVMLLGELRRWGLESACVERLLPHADRALAWVTEFGDRDGDGFVEYERSTARGLANQGWKDSWDGIRYGDGRVAEAPIALCEVQAYVYGAYLARSHFAHEAGDAVEEDRWATKAAELRAAFNRDFWLDDRGWFAVGLDADKRPIDSLASNMGHCLWAGIVDEDKAGAVAEALLSPAMFSGWGIRTLAAGEPAYNPVSYHCGSVWPHDSALAAAGLVRYGRLDEAARVMRGLLDAAAHFDGRLPELFSGLDREELPVPAVYPTSCSPQAWAAASPLLLVRSLLRLDPAVPEGRVSLAPALPPWLRRLRVTGIPLASGRLAIEVEDGEVRPELSGGLDDLVIDDRPREPSTAVVRGRGLG